MEQTKAEKRSFRAELKKQTTTYIIAALGFVTGLAWNEAFKALIEKFIPSDLNSLIVKFIYAVIATIVLVLFSFWLVRQEESGK